MLPFSFHKTILANLSLVCNTDGARIFKSPKYAIWPVWLAINELPPSQRYCICCFSLPYYNTYTYGKYRMGLDGTMPHYLAVRKAMVSIHEPIHSKITLTYSLTWQADRCTSRRHGCQGTIKHQGATLSYSSFLCAYCLKKLPERAPTKKQLRVV